MWWLSWTLASWLGGAGIEPDVPGTLALQGAEGPMVVAAPAERRTELEELARNLELQGRARHLPLLWQALQPGRADLAQRQVQGQRALLAILESDARSTRWLLRTHGQIPADLHGTVVAATRVGLGSRVVELWQGWIQQAALQPWILRELGELGPEVLMHQRDVVARWARTRLSSEDACVRGLAVDAAGHLRDAHSAPILVQLLEDSSPEVARKAARALARLAGEDLGSNPEAWRFWLRTQVGLWQQVPEQLELVRSAADEEALAVLRELRHVTWQRHSLARQLGPELQHSCPRRAAAVAETLGELRSEDALADLVQALDRSDLVVQSAAWRALRAITHQELGFDGESWHRTLMR